MNLFEQKNDSNNTNVKIKEDFHINFFIKTIDSKNIEEINNLINTHCNGNKNNKTGRDIVLEIYNKSLLTPERLNFIIENCNEYLYISSSLIKSLIKADEKELLKIIFSKFIIYDNEFIKWLLYQYKNKKPLSVEHLNEKVSNEKYNI
ncbi:hypothetical protein H8356DRAFT_939282, partial [Neocallimastix lanati (nom. inval.)]